LCKEEFFVSTYDTKYGRAIKNIISRLYEKYFSKNQVIFFIRKYFLFTIFSNNKKYKKI